MRNKVNTENILRETLRLAPEEFLGICKIVGIGLIEEEKEREFELIWTDLCEKVDQLSYKRKKNLMRLLRAANEGR